MKFKSVFEYLKPYKKQMILLVCFAVIVTIVSTISPFVSADLVDKGLTQSDPAVVITCVLLIILCTYSLDIIQYFQSKIEIYISNDLSKNLKVKVCDHGLNLRPDHYKDKGFYKTMEDALFDVQNISSISDTGFLTIVVLIFRTVGACIGLVLLDWRLTLCVAAIIPVKILINRVLAKRQRRFSKDLMQENHRYNTWYDDLIHGFADIKIWNLGDEKLDEFEGYCVRMNESSKKVSLNNAKNILINSGVENIVINSLYIIGVYMMLNQSISLGGLIAFIGFSGYLFLPLDLILNLRIILEGITPSFKNLNEFLALQREDESGDLHIKQEIRKIEFKDVCLDIEGKSILNNFNLTVYKGEKVAIIGDNGSGKTTVLNLLMRIYQPTSGEILFNDVPINRINPKEYRDMLSVVTQNVHLFHGTIRDNIILEKNTDETLRDDNPDFCVNFVNNRSAGFLTWVGPNGEKLSGGEKQKIGFLRALHRRSKVLILDEATSNYDAESDDSFVEYISKDKNYNFYFIVTHRKEILRKVDKVVRMKGGTVMTIHNNQKQIKNV